MKLMLAIVNDDDASMVSGALNKAGIQVTKLATTGGFLKSGNTTFLIGLDDSLVDTAIEEIRSNAKKRTQVVQDFTAYGVYNTMSRPMEITVGGATVFVLNVERLEKL